MADKMENIAQKRLINKIKKMKRLVSVIIIIGLFFIGCKGQETNPVPEKPKGRYISFEEKQRLALADKEPPAYSSKTAAFNFRYAAKKATPGVVHIKSVISVTIQQEVPDFFRDFFNDDFWQRYFPPRGNTPQLQMGSASGVIVSEDGFIVTNNHVVAAADSIEVVLHDQRNYKARIIGTDPATDLALLKIDENDLSFIEFGNSDSVEVGDLVLAVGNPFNLASTVTAGIVSAKARNINILTDKSAVESYIQTDAAVNRGNSGGALVDIDGKLVGINAAIATPTGAYAGYAFAIPVEIVKKTINDLLKYGKVLRGFLGVVISDLNGDKAKNLGIRYTNGVVVDSLQQNGAAVRAGIKVKDIIIKVNDRQVETATQLREIIARYQPGEKVQVTVIREGKEKIISVILMPAQEEPVSNITAHNEILKLLGIETENLSAAEKNELRISGGVKIVKITKGKIGSNTDIKEGFIITKVNGKSVLNTNEFVRELEDKKGGIMLEGIYPGIAGTYYYAFGL